MITQTLKKRIENSDLKHKFIAEKIGVSKVWFSKFYNGKIEFSDDKIEGIESLLLKFR